VSIHGASRGLSVLGLVRPGIRPGAYSIPRWDAMHVERKMIGGKDASKGPGAPARGRPLGLV
jgi:hypothetical protein